MNVYEVEIENQAQGYRLEHHLRAVDEADAIRRAEAHWHRAILGVRLRRACKPWEIVEQQQKDLNAAPTPPVAALRPADGTTFPALVTE